MKSGCAKRERGVVLLAMLAVIMLGASWLLVKQLNAESGGLNAARKIRNAEVLSQAKLALIGYVAHQAAVSGENNPGALPCPEAAGYFDNPSQDGQAAGTCTLPKIGRFPWRTIGTDKLVDSAGEPLWYVVSPGWALTAGNTVINSNSPGQLKVDGVANSAVALIIAPGPAFTVAAAADCAAKTQVRPLAATADKWQNYLECGNATAPPDVNTNFVTTGPSGSFNDQVIKITAAEVLPAIEAAIADRIQREVAPLLRSMYSGGSWSGSSTTPRLPFAVPFADPTASAMQGVAGTLQGLLPLVYSETSPGSGVACVAGVAAPRCNPALTTWSNPVMAGGSTYSEACAIAGTQINCNYYYRCSLFGCAAGSTGITVSVTGSDIGMAMRELISTATLEALAMTNVAAGRGISGVLNANGSATITVSGTVNYPGAGLFFGAGSCGLFWPLTLLLGCKQSTLSIPTTLIQDHPILDSTSTGLNQGWFLRNKWHEVAYYAVAADHTPSGAASCTTGGTCLTVNYHRDATNTVDAGKQRAIIVLSGRSLTGAARPNGTLADWLEGANADGLSPFETRSAPLMPNRTFNDRFAVIDSNP